MPDQVHVRPDYVSFDGHDAVRLYQALVLRAGLKLYKSTSVCPNRTWTPSKMLLLAGVICGKTYKRGQYQEAITDLNVWIETMKSAIPVTTSADRS